MSGEPPPLEIIRDLFFEQEHPALSIGYKHGWLRTFFVIGRAAIFTRRVRGSAADLIMPGQTVAVVFFENELRTVKSAPQALGIDSIVKLDMRALPVIRGELGLARTIGELWHFAQLVIRAKGFSYLRRAGIPAIGWLLYRAFRSILARNAPAAVITTNMIHPTSIGVQWATTAAGQRSVFFEHATTPGLIMKDRGYHSLYVNFGHTRGLMVSKGFDPARIRVLQDISGLTHPLVPIRVRTVALCINGFDSLQSIGEIADVLEPFGLSVTYRIHDADPRVARISSLAHDRGAAISLARGSAIHDFLKGIDLVITGNSNVIADALIAGKRVVYYWIGDAELFDYYGFVQHYGIPHARSRNALEVEVAALVEDRASC
jgi:hypothetical protein